MAKISDSVGRAFEEAIENKLTVLKQTRIVAWWEHQQPRMFRRGGVWLKGEASGADFSGVLEGGRAFALEAKSVGPEHEREPVLILEKHVSEKQRDHLNAVARAGGLAVLAVQFRHELAPWLTAVITWSSVPWERAKVRSHLRAEACARHRIPADRHLFEHLIGSTPPAQLLEFRGL